MQKSTQDNLQGNPDERGDFFNFAPIIQDNDELARGALVGTQLGPVSANLVGLNTEYGKNAYSGTLQFQLMNIVDSMTPEERKNYIGTVMANYDFSQQRYTPMFMLGYQNQNRNRGFGVSVTATDNQPPRFAAEYRRRF